MQMKWNSVILPLHIILGVVCCDPQNPKHSVRSARSGPATITRRNEARSVDYSELDQNMKLLLENIRALSTQNAETDFSSRAGMPFDIQPQSKTTEKSNDVTTLQESTVFNTYLNIFNNVYSIYQPVLRDQFFDNLPASIVCILSERTNCGLQAELTRAASNSLGGPLLSFLSSVRTQTCPLFSLSSRSSGTNSLFTSYFGLSDSTIAQLNAFQEMLLTALSSNLPHFSDNLMASWSGFIDLTLPPLVSFISDIVVNMLQTPMDFVRIGLQFGIEIPTLDQREQCQQGDLKQLLMWGMSHNVSWSFGESLLDMLLAPELPICSYSGTGCQSSVQFSTLSRSAESPVSPLNCNQENLALLNSTLCADLISAEPQESSMVYTVCRALGTLSPTEVTRVWRNSCQMIQAIFSPFLESSCSDDITSSTSLHTRVARSTLSLSQLVCNYANWTTTGAADPALVSVCSDNDREGFIHGVCNNAHVMQELVTNPSNAWVWNYCANSSDSYMVNQYCVYEMWMTQLVDPSVVTFCWNNDQHKLESLLCGSLDFFMLVFSNPENNWLIPNCTEPPTQMNLNDLVTESCTYSEWQNVMQIPMDLLSLCIQHDERNFQSAVCSNATFLHEILRNNANRWVGEYCSISISSPPTDPPVVFSISDWCSYGMWVNQSVDPSVVGLCWQHDQQNFHNNVCCSVVLFEKLTLDHQNQWLMSACADQETTDMLAQTCLYSEWIQPTIVDMTDLALCADLDPVNFTRKVCGNATILQNLLANLDNTWLLEHCSNHTGLGPGGQEAQGGSLMGFIPSQQCQYNSWAVQLPDPSLLALCWDYDQANFVSSICTDAVMLSQLSQEPSSLWVGTLCATYSNYTSNGSENNSTTSPHPCLVRDLAKRLNWSCSADFSAVCQPGSSQLQGLKLLLRCGVEAVQPKVEGLMTSQVTSVVSQVTNVWVVLLVALEESQMTSLRVTENIRLSVLESVVLYLERETNFDNKRILLQCFGRVLTSLMQTGRDGTSDGVFLIKEYFRIPLDSLRQVLNAVDVTTGRQILQYFSRNQHSLNLSEEYLRTMVSVFFHTHLARDGSLFPDLGPLLTLATPTDITSLPPLQNNSNVVNTINSYIDRLPIEQRQAFGRWFSKSISFVNTTAASPSLIRDTGNLIAYLPFQSFQHLSPAQLLDGLDVLLRNTLSPLKQQFVAQRLIGASRNLTVDQFRRLGNLTCLADRRDLLAYAGTEAFGVIQDNIRTCATQGLPVPSDMITSLFLNSSELRSPAVISSQRLSQLAPFLPLLGANFLQQLSQSQLSPILSTLGTVPFTPVEASVIVGKLSANGSLAQPEQLSALGSLVSGVKVETLWTLTSDDLLSVLPNIRLHATTLTPPQANAIITKLWGSPDVFMWLDEVEPLLSSTPLLSVLPRARRLVANLTDARTRLWNTQQAKALFEEVVNTVPNLSTDEFLSLGTIAQGVNCNVLKRLFLAQTSVSPIKSILRFLREQPVALHTSLKKCVVEELYHFDFFSELLGELGSRIALSLPVSTIKKFPANMMDSLRRMIVQDPLYFLHLPSMKQALLVDKMVQRLGMYTGEYTEEEFRLLGVMATFVADEVFMQLERSFFVESLEFLREFCYDSRKGDIVARMLQDNRTFGPVQNWNSEILNQVSRFLFFLPKEAIQQIPVALMTQERIERLFLAQHQWETGELGSLCMQGREQTEKQALFDKQQFVLQYFLGFLRVGRITPGLIPTCENLHMTKPAAWSIDSLTGMSAPAFRACLGVIGRDRFLTSYQLSVLLRKTKEVYGPPSSFSQSVISQLGLVASQLSLEELGALNLSEISAISALGTVSNWNRRQLMVLFSTMLNSTRKIPSQLDSSSLVALGHIVCGIDAPAIRNLNAVEFSKAVLWLGRLNLSCSEEQLEAMVGLLTHSLAFGPISSWGPEVFIEIGSIAVGVPDMAMSALVREQIEGITPLAISLIPPDKFAVVFNQAQIRMFSYEQAIAVTAAQRSVLTTVQQTALSMVLTPWEDKPVDFRNRSLGVRIFPCPLCLLLGLMLGALMHFLNVLLG